MALDKNLEKLNRLLSLMDEDSLTKTDFLKAFQNVVAQVKKLEEKNAKEIADINRTLTSIVNKMKDEAKGEVGNLKKQAMALVQKQVAYMEREHQALLNKVERKILEVKDGEDADEERIAEMVKETMKIPTIEELKDELPVMGDEVRDALELLQGEDRLDASAIKGLEELIQERMPQRLGGGGGFSKIAMEGHIFDPYTPTGTVNGVNTDFTLTKAPNPTTSLEVYVNGMLMSLTEDYTLSGNTVTFLTAPPSNSIIKVKHRG